MRVGFSRFLKKVISIDVFFRLRIGYHSCLSYVTAIRGKKKKKIRNYSPKPHHTNHTNVLLRMNNLQCHILIKNLKIESFVEYTITASTKTKKVHKKEKSNLFPRNGLLKLSSLAIENKKINRSRNCSVITVDIK